MIPESKFAARPRGMQRCALQHAGRAGLRRAGGALAAILALGLLAGCSSAFDALPHAVGGLPAEAPARAAAPPAFPEVHNMPPDRSLPVMNETEKAQAERSLIAQRDKQQRTSAATAKAEQDEADGTTTAVSPPKAAPRATKKNVKQADPSAGTSRNP